MRDTFGEVPVGAMFCAIIDTSIRWKKISMGSAQMFVLGHGAQWTPTSVIKPFDDCEGAVCL